MKKMHDLTKIINGLCLPVQEVVPMMIDRCLTL